MGPRRAPTTADEITLTGNIVGVDSGQALPMEVWIGARALDGEAWSTRQIHRGDRGAFTLPLPGPGRYQVQTRYGSFWFEENPSMGLGDWTEDVVEIHTDSGEFTQNLRLPEPVTIATRVVDAHGEPIAGANVSLSRMTPDYKEDFGALSLSRESDRFGRCTWLAKPGHEVWVSATAKGYTHTHSEHYRLSQGDEIAPITLTLRKTGAVSATLVDAKNRPLANKTYWLAVQTTSGTEVKGRCAQTDAHGRLTAPDFLVRDALRIELKDSKDDSPYYTRELEGPADRDLDLGRIVVSAG